jgi:hypothetical protein
MGRDIAKENGSAKIASLLVGFESILVLALAFYMLILGITHDKDWLPYLSVTAFAFTGAAALGALARGVRDGKRWANSPAILANLIALGVAKYQFEAGLYWLAIPIVLIAIAIIWNIIRIIRASADNL